MMGLLSNYTDRKLSYKQIIGIFCFIIVFSGFFGWFYEFIFYYFNSGMKMFYRRGGNFLPWINIYATGSIMILILTKRFKNNPFLVFLISFISTGILEFFSGFLIYKLFNLRFWDYNTEILNFLNIGGFVCLRSVLFFGFSALFLVYFLVPFFIELSFDFDINWFFLIGVILCSIVLFDEFYNLIISKVFSLPSASDIYRNIGFNFMNYH